MLILTCVSLHMHNSTYDSFSVKIVKFEEWHTYPSWTVNICPMRCACEYVLYDNDEIQINQYIVNTQYTIRIILIMI